jgi:hypothetical protein
VKGPKKAPPPSDNTSVARKVVADFVLDALPFIDDIERIFECIPKSFYKFKKPCDHYLGSLDYSLGYMGGFGSRCIEDLKHWLKKEPNNETFHDQLVILSEFHQRREALHKLIVAKRAQLITRK